MKNKLVIVVVPFVIITMVLLSWFSDISGNKTQHTESDPVFESGNLFVINNHNLLLDQGYTYIALSANDSENLNRAIFFYFVIQTEEDLEDEELESLLDSKFKEASLYFENGEAYIFNNLFWTSNKVENKYNLLLTIIPNETDFNTENSFHVDTLILNDGNKNFSYELSNFIIDAKETSQKDTVGVILSTIDTNINNNDYIANANIGIENSKRTVVSLELVYETNFANIIKHEILWSGVQYEEGFVNATNQKDYELDKNKKYHYDKYEIKYNFSKLNDKVIFRPFIKVTFDDDSEQLILPLYPSYISS